MRPRLLGLLLASTVLAGACAGPVDVDPSRSGGASGSPGPGGFGPPVLGVDWGRSAQAVERPDEAFAVPSVDPSVLASMAPNQAGHPEHFPGQAIMADVMSTPHGLLSVGYVYPGWHPVAWTSPDGETWSLRRLGDTEDTFPVALSMGSEGTIVAVGRSGKAPVAWTSTDAITWPEHAVPILGEAGVAERMTTVVATPGGFLAGGSVGPETLDRHARFWTSRDGATWLPVADDPNAFADAEVRSIVRFGSGYVAIGLVGTAVAPTGSVAWTSPDGAHWTRAEVPDLKAGRAVALVVAPGGGLVAVGSDLDEHEAFVWTSRDGTDWTRAPGEPSRQYQGKIRMNDVAVVGDHLIAVGDYVGVQFANMIAWHSTDGIHWTKAVEVPVFAQGEPYAVTASDVRQADGSSVPGVVAVGSFGNPDNYVPTVWLSPAH